MFVFTPQSWFQCSGNYNFDRLLESNDISVVFYWRMIYFSAPTCNMKFVHCPLPSPLFTIPDVQPTCVPIIITAVVLVRQWRQSMVNVVCCSKGEFLGCMSFGVREVYQRRQVTKPSRICGIFLAYTGWPQKTSRTLRNYNGAYTLWGEISFGTFVDQYVPLLTYKFQWHH